MKSVEILYDLNENKYGLIYDVNINNKKIYNLLVNIQKKNMWYKYKFV